MTSENELERPTVRRFLNEQGVAARTKPTTIVNRPVEVLQDLYWEECIAAVKLTDSFSDIEMFREGITDQAFRQPSYQTRHRYASYFIKWFLPTLSFDDAVARCWRGFRDEATLSHVMRWQFVTSTPLIAGFVDEYLSHVAPGSAIDNLVDAYFATTVGGVNERSRNRLRTNLRKVGLVMQQKKVHYRIESEVSNEAIAFLLAFLFAPEAQVVLMTTLISDRWWRRLGIADESALREKLRDVASAGLIAQVTTMDTLDQVTTRYSLVELTAGKARTK